MATEIKDSQQNLPCKEISNSSGTEDKRDSTKTDSAATSSSFKRGSNGSNTPSRTSTDGTRKSLTNSMRKTKSPAPQPPSSPAFSFPEPNPDNTSETPEDDKKPTEDMSSSTSTAKTSVTPDILKKSSLSGPKKALSLEETHCKNEPKAQDTEEHDQFDENITLRRKCVSPLDPIKQQNRASCMTKTKGTLYYKKKGPFSKWRLSYIVLDDCKFQMSFFKSQEEYEKLAMCKLPVDLRFITDIKPQKPKMFQSHFPFKLQRRAGLSTIKMAAHTEEERAKWITTIEDVMKRIKLISEMEIIKEEKRSSTLPNNAASGRLSSDSETQTSSSAPDQEDDVLIKPRKLSSQSGFKIDTRQISSLKLKRVSSEKDPTTECKVEKQSTPTREVIDPKEKFGVNLKRVQTEKLPQHQKRAESPEVIEFKEKYNSLSLSRKNKAPKIPLTESLTRSHVAEKILPVEQLKPSSDPAQQKETKDSPRKRSPSPNIPISKSVEAVIKNKEGEEKVSLINPREKDRKPKLSVCHATSAVISFDDSSALEIQEVTDNSNPEILVEKLDSVASTVDDKAEIPNDSNDTVVSDKPDLLESSQIMRQASLKIQKIARFSGTNATKVDHSVKSHNVPVQNIETKEETDKVSIFKPLTEAEQDKDDTLEANVTTENTTPIPAICISSSKETYNTSPKSDSIETTTCESSEIKSNSSPKINESTIMPNIPSKQEHSQRFKVVGLMSEGQIDSIVFGNSQTTYNSKSENNYDISHMEKQKYSENRSSTYSYQSQFSSESDEPLPRLNFFGKSNRSSTDSTGIVESLNTDDHKNKKPSSSDESIDQTSVLRDSSLKTPPIRPVSSSSAEKRSSLILPEFTVVEERADELLLVESPKARSFPDLQKNLTIDAPVDGKSHSSQVSIDGETRINDKYDNSLNDDTLGNEAQVDKHNTSKEIGESSEMVSTRTSSLDGELDHSNIHLEDTRSSSKELIETSDETNKQLNSNEICKLKKQEPCFTPTKTETTLEKPQLQECVTEALNLSDELDEKSINENDSHESSNADQSNIDLLMRRKSLKRQYSFSISSESAENTLSAPISPEICTNDIAQESQILFASSNSQFQDKSDHSTKSTANVEETPKEEYTPSKKLEINTEPEESIDSQLQGKLDHPTESTAKTEEKPKEEYKLSDKLEKTTEPEESIDQQIKPKDIKIEDDKTPQAKDTLKRKEADVVECVVEEEEAQDFFPHCGEAQFRIKDGKLAAGGDQSIRTSGIVGLKKFLQENDDGEATDFRGGISRLGHSPAIEKLRKEIP